MPDSTPVDRRGRPLRNLRLSVTDRCNLRCTYCMPEEEYTWLPKQRVCSYEELTRLVDALVPLGVQKVRLTGGEPLLRRDLHRLVRGLAELPGIRDLALTTNAVLLEEQAQDLHDAGLQRLTVSLDSLQRERYANLSGRDELPRALAGLKAARAAGFDRIKLNTVVLRGTNDDELLTLLDFAEQQGYELRFIEYMDVAGATGWDATHVLGREEILARVTAARGPVSPVQTDPAAPARRYALASGATFGVIASTTSPFCSTCDRARVTADGRLFTCLYAREGFDLLGPLRTGVEGPALAALVAGRWTQREDAGAEQRLAEKERGALADAETLKDHPHWEMHTKGG